MTRPARTIFLGSGSFAVPVLAALARHPAVELLVAVTSPPRPAGRSQALQPTPVGQWAADNDLPTQTPERLRAPAAIDQLRALAPELLVLADYGQIVPAELLELPAHGALNLHPSLLPLHRGASPIPATILAGDEQTGVTLMLMDSGLDSGPIVAQESLGLTGAETAPQLEEQLAIVAATLLAESLRSWLAGTIEPVAQSAAAATMTRPLRRADGALDPHRRALLLERQVRAYQPWPGSYLLIGNDRLVVWSATPVTAVEPPASPGTIVVTDAGLPALVTADGMLELREVQPAGGRRMTGAELLRGRPSLAGSAVDVAGAASAGGRG